jgi:hypothetical protein
MQSQKSHNFIYEVAKVTFLFKRIFFTIYILEMSQEDLEFSQEDLEMSQEDLDYYLEDASDYEDWERVQLLLEKGAKPTTFWALGKASENGKVEIVKMLLKAGADVNAEDDYALRMASAGHFEVVKLLLEAGANIHSNDDYPLLRATNRGHLEIVKLLLKYGANVRAMDDFSIKTASEKGYSEIVKELYWNYKPSEREMAENLAKTSNKDIQFFRDLKNSNVLHGTLPYELVDLIQKQLGGKKKRLSRKRSSRKRSSRKRSSRKRSSRKRLTRKRSSKK